MSDLLPPELLELVEFLHHGNSQIRQIAAENLVGYSLSLPQLFARNDYEPIKDLKLLVRDYAPIAANALTMLINLSGAKAGLENVVLKRLAGDEVFVDVLLKKLTGEWKEGGIDEVAMLFANLVKDESLVKKLVTMEREVPKPVKLETKSKRDKTDETNEVQVSKSKRVLDQLMDLFVTGAEGSLNPSANYDYLAYVFADISRLKEGRGYFLTRQEYDGVVPIRKLAVFTDEGKTSEVRRKGVASVIKNVCFEVDKHSVLLDEDGDDEIGGAAHLLPYILLPLAGPEEFDDQDSEGMLADLQLLPPDKKRENNADIIVTHLETLLLLTTSKDGREHLRRVKVYPVVRECHAAVENEEVRERCERLVNVLMRDEAAEEDSSNRIEDAVEEDTGVSKLNGKANDEKQSKLPANNDDEDSKMEEIF